MKEMKTIVPIVHLNGTSKEELMEQRFNAVDALHAAGDALAKAFPNGRDYYPNGPAYAEKARQQHDRRIGALKEIIVGLQDELEAIQGET